MVAGDRKFIFTKYRDRVRYHFRVVGDWSTILRVHFLVNKLDPGTRFEPSLSHWELDEQQVPLVHPRYFPVL